MKKFFIKADTVRNDAFALAKKLIDEDYIPDIMFVSMRGGAEMGNAMNEFFKFALGKDYKTIFATVVAHSYTDVQKKNDVVFDGWTYEPENVHLSHKVLVVDDICDSGATLKKIRYDLQFMTTSTFYMKEQQASTLCLITFAQSMK